MKREMVFGALIVIALLMFELFNFSTTDFALTDLMGDLRFAGLRWASILAVAFCAMDFAGIARLFTPGAGGPGWLAPARAASAHRRTEQDEVWYLLGAWFLAATMNAVLTWWGVSLALVADSGLGNEILSREQLLSIVPVFVAALVWLIRILLIGAFSMFGSRLFNTHRPEAPEVGRTAPPLPEEIVRRTPVRVIGDPPEETAIPGRFPAPARSPAPAPASPSRSPSGAGLPFRPAPKPQPSLSDDPNGHRNQFQNLLSSMPRIVRPLRRGAGD